MLTAYLKNDICNCILQAVNAPVFITRLNIKAKIYLRRATMKTATHS